MSRSGDRQWRRILIALSSALALSVVALGTSGFVASQTLELQQKIAVVDKIATICGPPGEDGLPGADGEDGLCGPVGATGPCGPPGPQGETGAQGEQGETGAQGEQGETGAQGEQGETGAQGEQGETGAQGEQGETGAQGEQGETGAAGITTLGHWGSFWDTANQPNPSAEPRAMRLNASNPKNCGVYIETTESGSKIFVTRAGAYNLEFSAQIKTTTNQSKPVDIWLSKNGSSVANTNTQLFSPDRKGIYIASWNFISYMEAGDYLELMWYSEDTNLYLSNLPAQDSIGIPAVPSLILTLTQVG
jgi:hypothetical protein